MKAARRWMFSYHTNQTLSLKIPQATQAKGTILPLPTGPGPVEFVSVTDVRVCALTE